MTDDERKKLVEEMARAIYGCTYDPDNFDEPFEDRKHWIMTATAALAIAEAAFAKEIEAAYKEGYKTGLRGRETDRSYSKDRCWRESRAAAALASIPEKNDDRA